MEKWPTLCVVLFVPNQSLVQSSCKSPFISRRQLCESRFFQNCDTFCFDLYWKYHNFECNEIQVTIFLKWTDFSETTVLTVYPMKRPMGSKYSFSWPLIQRSRCIDAKCLLNKIIMIGGIIRIVGYVWGRFFL